MRWPKGVSGNPKGGKIGNKGGGRKPDVFKRAMAELSSNADTLKYFRKVMRRTEDSDEFLVLATGVQVPIRVAADTWLKFWREAAAYGFGKAPQAVEVSGKDGQPLVVNMVKYGD